MHMLGARVTRHGIPKLTKLQGRFCECDVTVQVFPGVRVTDGDPDGSEPTQEYDAIVSDGDNSLPAIVNDIEGEILPGVNLVRVTKVVCCFLSTGQCILVINRFQSLINFNIRVRRYRRIWSSEPDASGGNPLPLAVLPYFPTELKLIPRMRVLVTYKSLLDDPHDCRFESGFLVHLLDESDEVRAYAKNQVAFDLYDKLETGKVYYITNLGNYGRCNEFLFNLQNPNSLELTRFTVIEECHDSSATPKLRFNFATFAQIYRRSKTLDQLISIDAIGVVQVVGPLQILLTTSKTWTVPGKEVPKRDVVIFDQSGQTLLVMLWSYNAEEFCVMPGTIVAFRRAKYVEEREELPISTSCQLSSLHLTSDGEKQRFLSVISTSTVHIEPDVEERFALRHWYNSQPQLLAVPSPQTTGNALCEPRPWAE